MSRICWPNAASSCRTKLFGNGAGSSAPITPGGGSDVKVDSEIRGCWTKVRHEGAKEEAMS